MCSALLYDAFLQTYNMLSSLLLCSCIRLSAGRLSGQLRRTIDHASIKIRFSPFDDGGVGTAHTFFSGATDKARAGELINVLREAGQAVPQELLAFGTTVKKKESKLYGAHFKEVDFSKKATKMTFGDSDDE